MQVADLTATLTITKRYKVRGTFPWLALVGTWIVALTIAVIATCGCVRPFDTIPTRDAQMSRAVQLNVICGNFDAMFTADKLKLGGQSGSGVIVGPHRILTAAHVPSCEKKGHAAIMFAKLGGSWRFVTLERSYKPNRDIASVYVEQDTGFPPIAFRSSVMTNENVCAAFAFPVAHYDCGAFERYIPPEEGVNSELAIPVVPGNSGSGLFDREGDLVGIIAAQRLCHTNVTITFNAGTGDVGVETEPIGGPDCDGMASMLDGEVTP